MPGNPVLPLLAAAIAFHLMLTLPVETWIRSLARMALGIVIHLGHGYRRSTLSATPNPDEEAVPSMTNT